MKNKKFRNRMIAVIMIICFLTNIVYFTIRNSQEAYAVGATAAGVAAAVGGDVVLSWLLVGLTAAGLYEATKSNDELEVMSSEELAEYKTNYTASKKEILTMLKDGGYFEGMEMEELIDSALNDINCGSALERYKNSKGLSDSDLNVVGSAGLAGIIASSSKTIKAIAEDINTAFERWRLANMEKINENSSSDSDIDISELPDLLFANSGEYVIYKNHIGIFYTEWKDTDAFTSSSTDSDGCITYGKTCYASTYKLSDGQWTWYTSWASRYNNISTKILYSSFDIYFNDELVFKKNVEPYTMPEDDGAVDAVQAVNDYLDTLGIKTRYSENLANSDSTVYDNVTTDLPYGGTYDGILIDGTNVEDIVTDICMPWEQALNDAIAAGEDVITSIDSALEKTKANTQAIADSAVPSITASEEQALTNTPTSSNFGSINLYKTDGLLDKFPFCIPADIFRCVAVLCADPVAPYWEFPFKIERWGIDETIVLDMSKFDSVAAISRWVETLCFIYILANKTKQYMFV